MSRSKKHETQYKFICHKVPYESKKEARKAAKACSGKNGVRYKPHSCKLCSKWHIYSANLKQIKHNQQHSRGGRRGRRKAVARKRPNRRRR